MPVNCCAASHQYSPALFPARHAEASLIDLPSRYRSPLFPDMFGQSHRVVRGGGASLSLLAVALGLAAAPAPARSEGEAGRTALESVVVTATRSPAEALNVPASVTVVGEDELEVRAPVRLGDALADVPGLYVRGAAMGTGFPGTGQGGAFVPEPGKTAPTDSGTSIDGQKGKRPEIAAADDTPGGAGTTAVDAVQSPRRPGQPPAGKGRGWAEDLGSHAVLKPL